MISRNRRIAMVALLALAAFFAIKDVVGGKIYHIQAPYDAYMRAFAVSRLILVFIAALIARKPVLTRRDGLLFCGILGLSLDVFWQYVAPGAAFWIAAALSHAAIGFGMAALMQFAVAAHPNEKLRRGVTIGSVAVGLIITLAGFAPVLLFYGQWFGQQLDDATFQALAPWLDRLRWLGMLTACLSIEALAAATLRSADGRQRQQALLVIASFAPLVVATSVHALARIISAHDAAWARDADAVGSVLTAAGLAYGALTRRLIDVEFYVSAAIIAALVGAALTVLAFLAEHFVVPWIAVSVEHLPLFKPYGDAVRIGAHLIAAFGAFLILTKVYEEAKRFARDVVFHHRQEHLEALRTFAERDASALAPGPLAAALVEAAMEHADASYAAVYVRDASGYRRLAGAGTCAPENHIAANDPRIPPPRGLRNMGDGSVALPMPIGTGISGFLVCGPKREATRYAPDELTAVGLATREAGIVLSALAPASA
jgi:hypothetical protein